MTLEFKLHCEAAKYDIVMNYIRLLLQKLFRKLDKSARVGKCFYWIIKSKHTENILRSVKRLSDLSKQKNPIMKQQEETTHQSSLNYYQALDRECKLSYRLLFRQRYDTVTDLH